MQTPELNDERTERSESSLVFVSDEIARNVLQWHDMIAAIRASYAVSHTPGSTPVRSLARGSIGEWMRTLTGIDPAGPFMGVKQFGFSQERKLSYLISLFDKRTGAIAALLDARSITSLRTAATTAVAVDLLAHPTASTLGVIGSGAEAATHARAIHSIRPLERLSVFSPNPENRGVFARKFERETGVPSFAVDNAELAVRGHDIVVGASRGRGDAPIIFGEWLSPDAVLASIGATLPEHWEVDEASISQAELIVCDVPEEVTLETKCFRMAAEAGIDFGSKIATLNDLVMGGLGSVQKARFRMYRSVGAAVQDISVATLAYRKALEAGSAVASGINIELKSAV